MRHRILLMAAPGCGKSQAIVDLARFGDTQVTVFDREDGIRPLLYALGETPENLDLRLIEGDPADAWASLRSQVKEVRTRSMVDDWICFDVAEAWWTMSQEAYVMMRYGTDLASYLADKIVEAVVSSRKPLTFGGLIPDDWQVIKSQYYTVIPQTLGAGCKANVMVTAQIKDVATWMKDGQPVYLEQKLPEMYKKAGIKPAGESALTGQVDVVLQLEHPTMKRWRMRTLGKNRLGVEFDWVDVTDRSVYEVYLEQLGGPA